MYTIRYRHVKKLFLYGIVGVVHAIFTKIMNADVKHYVRVPATIP